MRSQSTVLAHSTKSLGALTLTSNKQLPSSLTPVEVGYHSNNILSQKIQMTTGSEITGTISNSTKSQQKETTAATGNIISSSSLNTLSKASTISSSLRHSNGSLSMKSNNNISNNNNNNYNNNNCNKINNNYICNNSNNNNSTVLKNNNTKSTNNAINNANYINNENINNQNPNWTKLQTLEQRKLELEKLLNEKNWLLQQIHKQEAQILNGNIVNFDGSETDRGVGSSTVVSGSTNYILRRRGSSSLKLSKSNIQYSGKNNRYALSKSEYDLAQENKLNTQTTTSNSIVSSVKKRQSTPQKTHSFHDSTSASVLSLTKSPSFEYNGNLGVVGSSIENKNNHSTKLGILRLNFGSSEKLTNNTGIVQCDKYYLSPTSRMYSDGNGFIKASQNIKKCQSPSTLQTFIAVNDIEAFRNKQHHQTNGNTLVQQNENQSSNQYNVDVLSLPPTKSCSVHQDHDHEHSKLLQALSNNDRSVWCDTTSYIELDSEIDNQYNQIKSLAKKSLPPSLSGNLLQQHLPESMSLSSLNHTSGITGNTFPSVFEKSCDEVSISSVNSESNKKPRNRQWLESSLDGPIIRSNGFQTVVPGSDTILTYPALSPTLSQNSQYPFCSVSRPGVHSSAVSSIGKITPSSASITGVNAQPLVSVINSRAQTRTLNYHSHPHHKQNYRERTKLSSQSMSSGSCRTPKTKLDDENSHLSHSTSYLNFDPCHNTHFQQPLPLYNFSHNHMEPLNGSTITAPLLQIQQKSPKSSTSSTTQQPALSKFSQTQQQCVSSIANDSYAGTIRFASSVATEPSKLYNPSRNISCAKSQNSISPKALIVQQISPQSSNIGAPSPDIRIESPKNMTVVQKATFLPYKEVTKPFEMSDFYKYSTKFRQKEANAETITKNM